MHQAFPTCRQIYINAYSHIIIEMRYLLVVTSAFFIPSVLWCTYNLPRNSSFRWLFLLFLPLCFAYHYTLDPVLRSIDIFVNHVLVGMHIWFVGHNRPLVNNMILWFGILYGAFIFYVGKLSSKNNNIWHGTLHVVMAMASFLSLSLNQTRNLSQTL